MLENIDFLGHATFRINGSKTVYFDPYQLKSDKPADIILITHSHFDHLSLDDVKKIARSDTAIVCSKDCVGQLKPVVNQVIGIEPFEHVDVAGISIDSVPAYNIEKEFHPRENNWNGYIVAIDGSRFYHPGDTDKISEMKEVQTDIAVLPVGGTYTMDYREAAEAVDLIDPHYAVPMHYGSIVGTDSDAQKFVELVGERGVIIPPSP
jgi:L-ascorbate metabolism protein UlaG (beta-lactamase superfamily)